MTTGDRVTRGSVTSYHLVSGDFVHCASIRENPSVEATIRRNTLTLEAVPFAPVFRYSARSGENTVGCYKPNARLRAHSSICSFENRKSLPDPGRGMRGNLPSLTHFRSVSGCTPTYPAAISADQRPSGNSGLSILNRSSGGNEPGYQRLSKA